MLPGNYDQLLEMISRSSNKDRGEIERMIEAKRAKLSGLISKEGAAQIVASELGISFDKQQLKISELVTGMRKINITGKIVKMNRVIEYNKNGRSGKIGSFLLADQSSNVRVVLWDTNHIDLIEKGEIKEGDVVEVGAGDIRNGEMHLGGFSDIKKSSVAMDSVVEKPVVISKKISELGFGDNAQVRAFAVQIFGPTFFSVCPQCGKKVTEGNCVEHGAVSGEKRAILNFVLDDGSGTVRSVLFTDQIRQVASEAEIADAESFMSKRAELLGKEFVMEASARKNKLSEELELIVNEIKEADVEELIKELEA